VHEMLTIGRAARESGLTSDTLRYYERRRLIQRPRRSSGGYRLYDERTLERLRLIRHARSIGFSLDEIASLFAKRSRVAECASVRDLLGRKIEELDERIAAMTQFREALIGYRARCDRALAKHARCPLFDSDDD
jgi:MerR family transcriptional regulator, copper efflux regulator